MQHYLPDIFTAICVILSIFHRALLINNVNQRSFKFFTQILAQVQYPIVKSFILSLKLCNFFVLLIIVTSWTGPQILDILNEGTSQLIQACQYLLLELLKVVCFHGSDYIV